ncbi:hypothetical protein Vretimale_14478, partial [Volvox reticuliferus]
MWGVIAGAASRAQNLASNVKSVLLDEQDLNQQEYDDSGVSVEYTRYNHGPFDEEGVLEDAAFDSIGELPPVSSNAADAATPTDTAAVYANPAPAVFSASQAAAARRSERTHSSSTTTNTLQSTASATAVAAPAKPGGGYGSVNPHSSSTITTPSTTNTPHHYQNTDTFDHSVIAEAAMPSDGAGVVAGGSSSRRPAASAAATSLSPGVSGVGAGLGVGRMLGTATTTMSFFTSASSVLQKVATHVAGAEEATDGAKQKPQVELLKQQLIEVTIENDGLVAEVARLKRALEDAEDSAELLQAQSQTAALLRNELTTEQKAHDATRREVDKLLAKLRQLEQQVESDAADVAQHDSFWKAELEQQRAAVAKVQTRNTELEALVEQLQQQQNTAAIADATAAADAATERIAALEAQLTASQAAVKEAQRRVAVLEE